ncbi:tyrosine-type recombinase/integrase [Hyphococcus sp.]|uniref:tyrosine-type recombinase/integrase n=1 Tax=Hyphococcus sp. TaxID=2038636 RepID=UPI0035C73DE3
MMVQAVSVTADFLNGLKAEIREGTEKRSGIAYREASEGSLVRVWISKSSIRLKAQVYVQARGYNTYATLASFPVADATPIGKLEVKRALKQAAAYANENKTRREVINEDRARVWQKKTLRECMERYFELVELDGTIRTLYDRRKYIDKFLANPLPKNLKAPGRSTFGDCAPGFIDEDTAKNWRRDLERKTSKHSARLARAYVNAAFSYLVKEDGMPENLSFPVTTRVKFPEDQQQERNHPLNKKELKRLWSAFDELPQLKRGYSKVVWLTARRRKEISLLEWSWIDWDARVINFPARVMKNKRPYQMPLTPYVSELIRSQPKIDNSPFVFVNATGTPYRDKRLIPEIDAILAGEKNKSVRSRELAPFEWIFHDCRATARKLIRAANKKYMSAHIKVVLSHATTRKGDAINSYDSDEDLLPLKKEMYDVLENEMLKIVAPEKVEQNQQSERQKIMTEIDRLKEQLQSLEAQ